MSNPVFDALAGNMVLHAHTETPLAPIVGTRQAILAQSPSSPVFARATDTNEIFFWTGSAWVQSPFPTVVANANPDMGYMQDSSPIGIHANYLDSKLLTRITIGTTHGASNGAFWHDPNHSSGAGFFAYIAGAIAKFVTGLVLRELTGRLQFQPSGSGEWYDAARLNSTSVGVNGLPIVQDGQTSMGAYPDALIMDGGNAAMSNPSTPTLLLHGTIFRIRCRRMTDAERTALTSGQHLEGELIYATDTKKMYVSDGAGTLTALN